MLIFSLHDTFIGLNFYLNLKYVAVEDVLRSLNELKIETT